MRVLVVGRQGQLAQSFVQLALPRDLSIAIAGRPGADLASPDTIRRLIGRLSPEVVVNTAAYTAVDKAESEPDAAFALNAQGAENLARVTAEHGLPLIHVSTDYVFDGAKPTAYVETDPAGPAGIYGRSKLEGELRVAAANPRHIIARTAWLVGPHGHNFMRTMLRLAAERSELRIVADQRGSPTYAPDLAAALIEIARQMRSAGEGDARWGTYHVVNRGTATWHDLAMTIIAASAACGGRHVPVRPITTAEFPTPAARPKFSMLDAGKLERRFAIRLPAWRDRIPEGVAELLLAAAA